MQEDHRFSRLEGKVDKMVESTANIDKTLAVQAEQLTMHIKRTNLLEKQLEPIQKHVAMVNGGIKFLGLMAMCFEIYRAVKGE